MAKIKTRDTVKDIKVFDRAATVGTRMKDSFVKSKETLESADNQSDAGYDNPSEYASDQITGGAKDTANRAVRNNPLKKASENVDKAKRNMQEAKQQANNVKNAFRNNQPKKEAVKRAQENMRRSATRTKQAADRTVKQTARGANKTIKTTSKTIKGTARATRNTVKTAEQTAKVTVKTTQHAAKATQRAAQAAAKAAKIAAQAAKAASKATAQAAKAAAKATMALIKLAIAAIKALVAAIAAGGWVAVVIILVICLIGLLLGSVFGIFFSNEGDGITMSEVVTQINQEFSDKIDQIQDDNPHDYLVLHNSGNSNLAGNWRDVLAIYSVKTAGDEENGMEVVTLDDEKIAILREIFWDMNEITYSVTTTTTPPESITDDPEVEDTGGEEDEEDTEPKEYRVLHITVASKGHAEMSAAYNFTETQLAMLDELLLPEYQSLFMQLTGSYANISLSPEELAALMENLPQNIDERRKSVVMAAYSLIGKVNYFWGGKSTAMGWDSRWGTPTKVTSKGSSSSGTIRPFGMDCSGYVTWVFCNAAGTADAVNIIKHGSRNQYAACHKIQWNELQPGDLVFFNFKSPHVGIVIGKKPNGNVIIAHCASSRNNVVVDEYSAPKSNGFCLPGRPYYYN